MEGRLHPKRKTAEEKRESRRTREENERELMKKAREEGVRYVPPRRQKKASVINTEAFVLFD